VAAVKWNDVVRAGWITVTNIPAEYEQSFGPGANVQIFIGQTGHATAVEGGLRGAAASAAAARIAEAAGGKGSVTPRPETPHGRGNILNNTATIPVLRARTADGLSSYTETVTQDILLLLLAPTKGEKTVETIQWDQFVFRGVQIKNGRAEINFSRGEKR
jgi:hypothetical protein